MLKCYFINILWILDATIYVGGLDEKVSDPILWELFLQAGPVSKYCFYILSIFYAFTVYNAT